MSVVGVAVALLLSMVVTAHTDEEAKALASLATSRDACGAVVVDVRGAVHAVTVDVVDNDRPTLHLRVRVFQSDSEPLFTANILDPKKLTITGFVLSVREWQSPAVGSTPGFMDGFGRIWLLESGTELAKEQGHVRGVVHCDVAGRVELLEQGSNRKWARWR